MSTNFGPQFRGATTIGVVSATRPVPPNIGGDYLAAANRQYYSGAVRLDAGSVMRDAPFVYDKDLFLRTFFPNGFGGGFIANPEFRCGTISFWIRYSPTEKTEFGWPLIGQLGSHNMSAYFGTDPVHTMMGTINVELVPLSSTTPVNPPSGGWGTGYATTSAHGFSGGTIANVAINGLRTAHDSGIPPFGSFQILQFAQSVGGPALGGRLLGHFSGALDNQFAQTTTGDGSAFEAHAAGNTIIATAGGLQVQLALGGVTFTEVETGLNQVWTVALVLADPSPAFSIWLTPNP